MSDDQQPPQPSYPTIMPPTFAELLQFPLRGHDGLLSPPAPDMVNHPPHYTSHPSGVECITITRHMSFNLGNALKYIWRADLKGDAIEDLKKAAFYIQDELEKRKEQK